MSLFRNPARLPAAEARWLPTLPILILAASSLGACGEARESTDPLLGWPAVTYREQIEPLLRDKCLACHGGAKTEGSYDVSSWRGVLGPGSDKIVRNAVAGDAQSLLLTVLDDATHGSLLDASERELLRTWVVDDRLAYLAAGNGYHLQGWLYPGDREAKTFHGGALRKLGWDMSGCQVCHGESFDGGLSGVSCKTCHSEGPTGCATCHGGVGAAPPSSLSWGLDPAKDRGVGVHQAHRSTKLFVPLDCADCHPVPTAWDAPGHLFDDPAGTTSDRRAEVVFGPRASQKGFQASYDAKTGTCQVYCHAPGTVNPGDNAKPSWTAPGSVTCGSCHGVPHTGGLGGPDCTVCHKEGLESCTPGEANCLKTADGVGVRFTDIGRHGDGKAAPTGGTLCWSCHGTEASGGAPGPDLAGNTDTKTVTVGLHATHLSASLLTGAIACSDCHVVPKAVGDAGHLDTAAPAEVTFSELARGVVRNPAGDLKPTWDRKTGTCNNVYCHSLDGHKVQTWSWTSKVAGGVDCDSCHGLPPAKLSTGATHPAGPNCSSCHATAFKNGLLDPTKHINGKVDL